MGQSITSCIPEAFKEIYEFNDYTLAFEVGKIYADKYIDYMENNPDDIGACYLGHLAKSIDFNDSTTKGCWLGFFSKIEEMLFDVV